MFARVLSRPAIRLFGISSFFRRAAPRLIAPSTSRAVSWFSTNKSGDFTSSSAAAASPSPSSPSSVSASDSDSSSATKKFFTIPVIDDSKVRTASPPPRPTGSDHALLTPKVLEILNANATVSHDLRPLSLLLYDWDEQFGPAASTSFSPATYAPVILQGTHLIPMHNDIKQSPVSFDSVVKLTFTTDDWKIIVPSLRKCLLTLIPRNSQDEAIELTMTFVRQYEEQLGYDLAFELLELARLASVYVKTEIFVMDQMLALVLKHKPDDLKLQYRLICLMSLSAVSVRMSEVALFFAQHHALLFDANHADDTSLPVLKQQLHNYSFIVTYSRNYMAPESSMFWIRQACMRLSLIPVDQLDPTLATHVAMSLWMSKEYNAAILLYEQIVDFYPDTHPWAAAAACMDLGVVYLRNNQSYLSHQLYLKHKDRIREMISRTGEGERLSQQKLMWSYIRFIWALAKAIQDTELAQEVVNIFDIYRLQPHRYYHECVNFLRYGYFPRSERDSGKQK